MFCFEKVFVCERHMTSSPRNDVTVFG